MGQWGSGATKLYFIIMNYRVNSKENQETGPAPPAITPAARRLPACSYLEYPVCLHDPGHDIRQFFDEGMIIA